MGKRISNIITVAIIGALFLALTLCCWLKAPGDYSESERRALAAKPELTAESVFSGKYMKDFESYATDQYPFREDFRRLKAVTVLNILQQRDNNGLYLSQGHLSKVEYPLNERMLEHAAERFRYLYDTYMAGKDVKLYLAVVPDKNYYLAEENGYLSLDYDRFFASMQEKTPYMEPIALADVLKLEDYYRTDTHWRQERLMPVVNRLAEVMGFDVEAGAESESGTETGQEKEQQKYAADQLPPSYRLQTLDHPFYGVYYGQAALPVAPDEIKYVTSDLLDQCIVTSYGTGSPKEAPLYNMEKAYGKDPYEMFLSGTEPLVTIENPGAATDRELILFRDSYGSSLAPLLAGSFAKITLVDIRYMQSNALGNYITFEDQDVLFLYSTVLLNNSLALK